MVPDRDRITSECVVAPPAGPGAPLIEVRALVLGGELAVRTPPKSRRFRLFSRN